MDAGGILALAQQGGLALLVGYLVWRDMRHDKWRQKHEEDKSALEAKHRVERMEVDRERTREIREETASREKQTGAITALTMVVQGLSRG